MALTLTRLNSICKPRWLLFAALPVFLAGALSGFLATRGHKQEQPVTNTDRAQPPSPPIPKNRAEPEAKLQPVKANLDGPTNNTTAASPQRWEYKVLALHPLDVRKPGVSFVPERQADKYTEEFNKLGQDGWEYQGVPVSVPGGIPGDYAIFRRPRQQ